MAPYTPQQKVCPRGKRALKEMVNSMLSYSGLSEKFWGEAMLTACYLLNRIPNKNNKITHYEIWYNKRPNLSYLRVLGCRAIVRLLKPKKKILSEKGIDCIFIGYAKHSKAYRFYVIETNDFISVNSVIDSRDAIFDKNKFSSIPRPKDIISNSNGTQGGDLPGETPIKIPEPRRSNKARVVKLDHTFDPSGFTWCYTYAYIQDGVSFIAKRSMFEREKLFGNNFNEWFCQLKLVLRVEKKMYVIEQPIPPAPTADFPANMLAEWNVVYDAHNEVACLMSEDLSVGLILNCLTSDFAGFMRNYNMHNMGKMIGELHAMLIEYEKGKMTRKPFLHRTKRVTDLLGIIHTDACDPLIHESIQGASYFITFTDDYSRYGYVYLLKHKHEVFETFKVLKNEVKNQLGMTIKALRLDRVGEYISQEFKDYLKACGIVQRLTPSYTSQHNGMSERRNHTLLDMVRSMMNLITLSLSFWDYALESATRILNMVQTKKRNSYGGKGFKPPQEEVILICRYERTHQSPNRLCLNVEVEEHSLGDLNESISYKAAMLDSESNKWLDAMNTEMQSMIDNMVWVLVDLPPNCKTVESKWIFKKKTDMDGIVHTYKARLVAKEIEEQLLEVEAEAGYAINIADEEINLEEQAMSGSECVSLLSSLFNHYACVAAAVAAMNSDSHNDSATVACFCVLQLIGDSP
nr:zinc finger, CCHC-type [Tanacetum cinerariifolium]